MTGGVPAVVARDLSLVYPGGVVGVSGLDVEVRAGEVLGLVGRNGAGKSTALSLLSGRLRPTRGTVAVLGLDTVREPLGVRRLVGVMPGADATFERLTGRETVELIGRLHGLTAGAAASRAAELLDLLQLAGAHRDRLAIACSTGMRRKIQLACALVHAPRVLLLDEPLAGLDPTSAAVVRRVAREMAARGRAVVVSSHALDVVQRIADRVLVLHDGRAAAAGTLDDLRARAGAPPSASLEDVFLELTGGPDEREPPEWLR